MCAHFVLQPFRCCAKVQCAPFWLQLCSTDISLKGFHVCLKAVLQSIMCMCVFVRAHRPSEETEEDSAASGGRQNHDNLYRVHMPSLYSCGSSYGSETSIPAAAHTVSNAPVTEYMYVTHTPSSALPHI